MCFKSSSTTKTHQDTANTTLPHYGQSDAFNNFMTGYNNQYSPENFAKTQEAANINPYTTEAAQRQSGIFPVLSSTMNNTQQIANEGLSQADINRYKNPYTDAVVNPMLQVFDQQNRAALNNIGGKMAAQGAIRNSGMGTAKNSYYQAMQPGQNLQVANLYNSMYDKAVQAAQANIQAKLQGAQTTNQLASGASAAAQTQFNMGDAMRNAGLQKSMIPYQLYNQGLAGQQTAGNMYGVSSTGKMDGTSTTTNSPSLFDSALKLGSAVFGAVSGFPMGAAAGTSVQGPGGWTTSVNPASSGGGSSSGSSWWPFADGGKVVARGRVGKAGGGGIATPPLGSGPGGVAQQVAHFTQVFGDLKRQQKAANGGGIGKAEGGGMTFDEEYGTQFLPPALGAYTPPETFSLGPPSAPRGPQFGPPAPAPEAIPPDYSLDYSDHRGANTSDDPTMPQPFQPKETPTPAAPVMRPYPEPTPPRPLSDPRTIKQGVYTVGGRMADPGSFGAYTADLSSLFGKIAGVGDPMGSMADRRREGIQQIMNHEKDANEATRLYEDMKQRGIHFGNQDRIAEATAAREAERAPLLNLQTQVATENTRQGIPTEIFNIRHEQALKMGMTPGTPEYYDYVTDGKYSQNKGKVQETALDKAFAGATVKDYEARAAAIASGQAKLHQYEQMAEYVNNPAVAQGAGAGMILQAKKIGQALGMTGMDKDIADAEALNAMGNQSAMAMRSTADGQGMPGAMSDADRVFLTQSNVGLGNSQGGNQLLIKLNANLEKYKIASNLEAQRYIDKTGSNRGLSEYMTKWHDQNKFIDTLPREVKAAADAEAAKNRTEETTKKVAELAALAANAKVGQREQIKTADGRTMSVEKMADGRWRPLSEQEAMQPPAKPGSRENPRKYGEADSEKGDYVRKDGRLQRRTGNVFFDRYEDVDDAQGRTSKP